MKYYFVTVATHSANYYDTFIESCNRHNININILGKGETYYGHHMKDDLVIKFTENKNPNDILIFVDAYDSLILVQPEIIIQKFLEKKKNLIVSSESIDKCNFIHKFFYRNYKKINNKYLNTGIYIGYCGYINTFLKKTKFFVSEENKNSNQLLWQDYLSFYPNQIYIDDNDLFLNLSCNYYLIKLLENIYHPCIISAPSAPISVDYEVYLNEMDYQFKKVKIDYYLFFKKFMYQNKDLVIFLLVIILILFINKYLSK